MFALAGVAGVAVGAPDGSLTTVNETVRVHAVEDATVTGTTDLDSEASVSVRVRSSGDTTPRFIRSEPVRVGEDGSIAATFNFSEYDPGDTFTVTVIHDGSTIAEAEGEVVADDVPVTPTRTPETTTEATEITETTDTTGPGFGTVTATASVCLGAALAARRHR